MPRDPTHIAGAPGDRLMAIPFAVPSTRLFASSLLLLAGSLLMGAAAFAPSQAPPPPAPTANTHPEFPQGKGREITLTKCSGCHSANNILAQGRTRAGWEDIITKMVGFGATGTDEEFTQIDDYLTKNFPPAALAPITPTGSATPTTPAQPSTPPTP